MSLKDLIDHPFSEPSLLDEALTHPSVGGSRHYQRLEFLGDRVLGLVVAARLYRLYPTDAEGRMNRRLSALVRKETLAEIALEMGLDQMVKVQDGPNAVDLRNQPAVLADALEAVIGAHYLDGGLTVVEAFIRKNWGQRFDEDSSHQKDAKSALQEWAQARRLGTPAYRVLDRKGTDHAPEFIVEVAIPDHGTECASDNSKRGAEQTAAALLFARLTSGKKERVSK